MHTIKKPRVSGRNLVLLGSSLDHRFSFYFCLKVNLLLVTYVTISLTWRGSFTWFCREMSARFWLLNSCSWWGLWQSVQFPAQMPAAVFPQWVSGRTVRVTEGCIFCFHTRNIKVEHMAKSCDLIKWLYLLVCQAFICKENRLLCFYKDTIVKDTRVVSTCWCDSFDLR